jgi:hypothetical protein
MTEYDHPPKTDWWLASDGQWYPPQPVPTDGWWFASDGKWYPHQPSPAVWSYPGKDPAEAARRSRMFAVTSLICGLAGIFIMTAFAAIGLGIAALVVANNSQERRKTDIVMAILGILAGGFWLYLASVVNW